MKRGVLTFICLSIFTVLLTLTVSSPQEAKAFYGCPNPWDICEAAKASLSSDGANACPDDSKASCIGGTFTVDAAQTASFVFDCSGDTITLPLLRWLLSLLGIPLTQFEKLIIPGVPTPMCTLFAQGSKFEVIEVSPNGTSAKILEETYNGWKHEGTFTVKANYTYNLALNARGRDFREVLKSNNIRAFDSFAQVSYQTGKELDLPDDSCENAIYFDLPYQGNLEFSGDNDWQRIKAPVKGTMVLTLDVPADKDYQLEVRNDACSAVWVGSPHGTGGDEQIVMPVDPAYYRVHVFGKTPEDFGAWYSVSAVWDLYDNTFDNAIYFDMPYQGILEYSGDHDWQRIHVPTGNIFLVLDVPAGKDYQLELWRHDAKIQLGSSSNGAGVDESILISQPGDYRVHIFGANPASDFGAHYRVFLDGVAPSTTVALSGTTGNNGWYRSNVQVTLKATDNPGGSGVQKTEYGFDGTPWNPYTGPWNVYSGQFTVSAEGHTYLVYRAVDIAGNVEPNRAQLIKIDKTPPTMSGAATTSPNANGWYKTNVVVDFSASDFVSGVASLVPMNQTLSNEGPGQSATSTAIDNAGNSTSLTVGNLNIDKTPPTLNITGPQAKDYAHTASVNVIWTEVDSVSGMASSSALLDNKPVANGQVVDLFYLGLGAHTVTVQAKDKADNAASLSVTFKVVADINSLLAAAKRAYDLGWIDKQGVYNNLDAKLSAAKAAIDRGQTNAARNQLNALLNELNAQKGKAMTPQAFELLKNDVLYVIAHLP